MTTAIPIEVRVEDEAVRGHELDTVGPPVVLLHEPGRDLDAWGPVTSWLARKGFKVIALDLPGHGLSDGEADDWERMLADVLAEICRQFGPIGIAAAGDACRLLPTLGPDEGVPVQAFLSPGSIDDAVLKRSGWGIRLVMCGPADREAHDRAKAVYDGLRGEKVMVTGGGGDQGTELVAAHRHLAEELVMWFRRYLTPYHLRWIRDLTDGSSELAPKEH